MNYPVLFSESAKKAGVGRLSFYIEEIAKSSVSVFQGEVDDTAASRETLVYIEGEIDGKKGSAFTEDLSPDRFAELIETLRESAAENSLPYRHIEITPKENIHLAADMDIGAVTPELLAAGKAAQARDTRIFAASLRLNQTKRKVTLADGDGRQMVDCYSIYSFFARAVARDGEQVQTGSAHHMSADMPDFTALANTAADEAIRLLGAAPCAGGKYPVLFSGSAFGEILEAFMPMFYGRRVLDGTSMMKGKLRQTVAAPGITLEEIPTGLIKRSFDDEGTQTREKSIIKDGKLQMYLHNSSTENPGGNGFRPSYRAAVDTGYTCIRLSDAGIGCAPKEEIIAGITRGLLITECDGVFAGVNPISGGFSLISKGWLIENGKLAAPVGQITVGGTFEDLFTGIKALTPTQTHTGSPAAGVVSTPDVLVENLTVSGV